jgi:hypothetical protein
MKRRDFVKIASVAPLGLLPLAETNAQKKRRLLKELMKYKCAIILDYSNSDCDEHGRVFRRVLFHPDVPEMFVKKARLYPNGVLLVSVYCLAVQTPHDICTPIFDSDKKLQWIHDHYGLESYQKYMRFRNRIFQHSYDLDNDGFAKSITMETHIYRHEDWELHQYSSSGDLLKVLTREDFIDEDRRLA